MTLVSVGARRRGGQQAAEPVPYALPTARPYNAPHAAITPTYDGSGEAIHPSVVDMQRYGGPWHGWRYWMAMTPFPGGDAALENPSILVSNNGYHWSVPAGLTNPVYPAEPSYHSDTHLTYDPDTDELVMIFRHTRTGGGGTFLRWARSSNGSTWPAHTEVQLDPVPTSPSIMKVGTEWHIYAIRSGSANQTGTYLRWRSSDLTTWAAAETLTGLGAVEFTWHLSVQYFDGQFWALHDRGPAHLTGRPDGFRAATSLDGLTWAIAADDMLTPIGLGYETYQHYRADFQPHEDGMHMRVWYSHEARETGAPSGSWGTSYTQVRRDEWPAPPA